MFAVSESWTTHRNTQYVHDPRTVSTFLETTLAVESGKISQKHAWLIRKTTKQNRCLGCFWLPTPPPLFNKSRRTNDGFHAIARTGGTQRGALRTGGTYGWRHSVPAGGTRPTVLGNCVGDGGGGNTHGVQPHTRARTHTRGNSVRFRRAANESLRVGGGGGGRPVGGKPRGGDGGCRPGNVVSTADEARQAGVVVRGVSRNGPRYLDGWHGAISALGFSYPFLGH